MHIPMSSPDLTAADTAAVSQVFAGPLPQHWPAAGAVEKE